MHDQYITGIISPVPRRDARNRQKLYSNRHIYHSEEIRRLFLCVQLLSGRAAGRITRLARLSSRLSLYFVYGILYPDNRKAQKKNWRERLQGQQ